MNSITSSDLTQNSAAANSSQTNSNYLAVNRLSDEALAIISSVFNVECDAIRNIRILKRGMTNRSFTFVIDDHSYIIRVPGEGTQVLIDRHKEAAVYRAIAGKGLCDDPIYIDPDNGYKITSFIPNIRTCSSDDEKDLRQCMNKLRAFHEMNIKVEHCFDLYERIAFYESLWGGSSSVYEDYDDTKKSIWSLRPFIESTTQKSVLTHIDAVADNFLFDESGHLQLTDWEYAGMADPHIDIAMFCIYSLYERNQVDRLIDIYFENSCSEVVRTKIYCYIAICGLLWSNWCEYKALCGVEFGEYSLRQYSYAQEYYLLAKDRIEA